MRGALLPTLALFVFPFSFRPCPEFEGKVFPVRKEVVSGKTY